MARKMPKKLESWLIPRLRNISRYWPGKTIARDLAKVKVPDGFFKNGKPKFKTMWRCASCKDVFDRELTQMDHREPVVHVSGFKDWNEYITRLLCDPAGYDCLCITCHGLKTEGENIVRKKLKK